MFVIFHQAQVNGIKLNIKCFLLYQKTGGGKPLITRETVVNLIGNTKTQNGLKIKVKLDESMYKKVEK